MEGAGNTTEIQTLLTLTLLLYALQILPLLVRPNLNKFAPSNLTNSPPSISGRPNLSPRFLTKRLTRQIREFILMGANLQLGETSID